MKGNRLGELEELVLLAVLSLNDEAYGVSVQQRIERGAGRRVTIGAVYAALERLERKHCVRSWIGQPGEGRGGRRKRHFAITTAGREALEGVRDAREQMWRLVESGDA
jgi:DNA-binding PadR family transcriptional regulator